MCSASLWAGPERTTTSWNVTGRSVHMRTSTRSPSDSPAAAASSGDMWTWFRAMMRLCSAMRNASLDAMSISPARDRSPERATGGCNPSVRASVADTSTCVCPRGGPRIATFGKVPFGPMRVTRSSDRYCPGWDSGRFGVSSYPGPNRCSTSSGDRWTCRPDASAGTGKPSTGTDDEQTAGETLPVSSFKYSSTAPDTMSRTISSNFMRLSS